MSHHRLFVAAEAVAPHRPGLLEGVPWWAVALLVLTLIIDFLLVILLFRVGVVLRNQKFLFDAVTRGQGAKPLDPNQGK